MAQGNQCLHMVSEHVWPHMHIQYTYTRPPHTQVHTYKRTGNDGNSRERERDEDIGSVLLSLPSQSKEREASVFGVLED